MSRFNGFIVGRKGKGRVFPPTSLELLPLEAAVASLKTQSPPQIVPRTRTRPTGLMQASEFVGGGVSSVQAGAMAVAGQAWEPALLLPINPD